MATSLFSLLDLLASRFRSDSDNDNTDENPSSISIQVSDTEPQSQPRSRSHTETTRPAGFAPNRSPNRSPNISRQNRSHTTVLDPNAPPGALSPTSGPGLLSVNHPISRQHRRSTQFNPNRRSIGSVPRPVGAVPTDPTKLPTTTTTTTATTATPIDENNNNNNNLVVPQLHTPSLELNNNNEQNQPITLVVPNSDGTSITTTSTAPAQNKTANELQVSSFAVGSIIATTPGFQDPNQIYSSQEGIEMQEYIDQEDDGEYTDDDIPIGEEFPIEEEYDQDPPEEEAKKELKEPFNHLAFFKVFGKYFSKLLVLTLMVSFIAVSYGVFEIYAGCRFVDINHEDWPTWGIAVHAVSRVILNFALCMYPYVLLLSFFGFRDTLVCLLIGIVASSGASVWAVVNTVKNYLDPTLALLPSYFFFVVALLGSSHYMGRKINSPTFRHLFMAQFVLAAVALVLYDFLLVPWYTRSGSVSKSVVRILIHPGICATALFVSRACSSRINPKVPGTQVFPVLIFMWFSTYYGRFFNSSMSLLFMTGTMAIVSLLELFWRTTLRPRDKKIMNAICGYCFKRKLTHSTNFDKIYRDFLRHEQLYENTSILTSCLVYIAYYNVFDKEGLSYSTLFASMAIQFSLEWVTDLVSMYIESRVYNMDVLHYEQPPKGFYFLVCYTFFLGMAYSTSRVILISEGKWLADINSGGSTSASVVEALVSLVAPSFS
ncbi:hypothetical protein CYY_007454 [Polysphondylium violaceum]|uniref:Transmembrane protein n=1 Tax=Polysphondylium violaceum TaxID=133409 RepID=A0A8J4UXQ2_9MYCE|nr:hypothetical protein CYY_007454 [Polysphondylium violaceum]